MDENSYRRAEKGYGGSRRVSSLISRKTSNSPGQDAQFGNQTGCSSRSDVARSSGVGCSENCNTCNTSYRFAESGKRVVGGSSLTSSTVISPTKVLREPQRKLFPKNEKCLPESSSTSSGSGKGSMISEPEVRGGLLISERHVAECTIKEVVVPNTESTASTRPHKNHTEKYGTSSRDGSSSSLFSKAPRCTFQGLGCSFSSSRLQNSKCNLSSELSFHRRMDLLRKKNVQGESCSSSRGKETGQQKTGDNCATASGISMSNARKPLNWQSSGRDNGVRPVRSSNSVNSIPRVMPVAHEYGNSSAPGESNAILPHLTQYEIPSSISTLRTSDTIPFECHTYHPNTSDSSTSSLDLDVAPDLVSDGSSPNNMDGITEILLALERIGLAEQLSYERLLFLEVNSFLSGLSFQDQHRDMRLDIDDMSYEELLALGDRIGSVSTALTEEAIENCLIKTSYNPTPSEAGSFRFSNDGDDLKCSICQDEYTIGDEVGRLQCEHLYHVCCIQQWLSQKNWCPICKTSAAAS